MVPLSFQPGPVTVCYIQLPPQVGDVVLEEGLQVALGTFLLLEEVPFGFQKFILLFQEPHLNPQGHRKGN